MTGPGSHADRQRKCPANYSTDFRSIRDDVSAQEWQTRIDLAACYRLVDHYGMSDLIYNHITARIPGTEHLLINLYGLLYKEITASSLVKIDLEGNIVWKPNTDYGINVSGYVIHGAIHMARADVACVLHTHTRAGMAVAGDASADYCHRCRRSAMRFVGRIGHARLNEGPAVDPRRARSASWRNLGPHDSRSIDAQPRPARRAAGDRSGERSRRRTKLELLVSARRSTRWRRAPSWPRPGQNVLADTAHLYQPGTRRPYRRARMADAAPLVGAAAEFADPHWS